MIEEELGAMFKRIAAMAEDRYSDYAIGKAVMEMVEAATTAIAEQKTPLSAAEKMDIVADVENAIEERIDRSSLNVNPTKTRKELCKDLSAGQTTGEYYVDLTAEETDADMISVKPRCRESNYQP